ncbi:MAG: hypothetical protein Fur0025_35710 [Oscillatoriaceae cyanobacterium]
MGTSVPETGFLAEILMSSPGILVRNPVSMVVSSPSREQSFPNLATSTLMKLHWRLIYTCGCSLLIGIQIQIPGCSNNVAKSVDSGNLPAPTPELSGQQVCDVAKSITVLIMSADGRSEGTGFLIDQKPDNSRPGFFLYKVVTNAHVVTKANDSYQIQTSDGNIHRGIQLFRFGEASSGNDLAILQFQSNKPDYTIAKLAPGLSLAPNQARVVAAGFPIRTGAATTSEWVCTPPGAVSFVLQPPMRGGYGIGYYLDIRKGMSGGPLLNLQGEVVGINGRHSNPPFGGSRIYIYENGDAMTQPRDLLMRSSWAIPMDTLLPLAISQGIPLAYHNTPNQPAPPPNIPVAQQTPTPNQPEGEIQYVETPPPNVPVAQETPTPNQPEGEIRFECVNIRGVPTTVLTDGTRKTTIKQWYPGPGYFSNPQQRCEEVSRKFQDYHTQGLLENITTGQMNGQNLLCVTLERGRQCEGPSLFTILPGKNPTEELREITNRIRQFDPQISANPRPATESSPRPTTDLGCGNAASDPNYNPELERRAQRMLVKVLIGDYQRTGIVIERQRQNYQVLTYAGLVGDSYSIQTDDGSIIPALPSKTILYQGNSLVVLDFYSENVAYEAATLGNSSSLIAGTRVFTAGYSLASTSSESRVFQLQPGEIMPLPNSQPGNQQRLAISNRVDEGGIGGPLLNCRGEVVGIVDRQNYVSGGWTVPSDEDPDYKYSWAIPIEQVYPQGRTGTNTSLIN